MRSSQCDVSDGFHHSKNLLHSTFVEFLDILVSCSIVGPCVIGYWRGTWELLGYYILPENVFLSALISFLIGIIGHLVMTFAQTFLKRTFHPDKNRLTYYFVSRLYTALFGIICVNLWRGAWILCDKLTGANVLSVVVTVTSIAIILMILTKTIRNLGAAPFALAVDHPDEYFEVSTMFKTPGFRESNIYILDTLFTVIVVGTLVVIVWRGVWVILDLTLYPESKIFSAWGSLTLGYGIAAVTFALQPIVRWICDQVKGLCRLIISDLFLFISFMSTVNIWRGIFMLLDIYLVPENLFISNWISHSVCLLLLMILNCSNSILVRGVFIDGAESSGDCVVFPIFLIRLHFERERRKKENRKHLNDLYQNQNTTIETKPLTQISIKNNNDNLSYTKNNKIDGSPMEIKPMMSVVNEKSSLRS